MSSSKASSTAEAGPYVNLFRKLREKLEMKPKSASKADEVMKIKLKAISEIRERLEIVHTNKYECFLTELFPVFEKILGVSATPTSSSSSDGKEESETKKIEVPPKMYDDSNHKLRNVTLEVLNRLPNSDRLKPYINKLLAICSHVLSRDNEENALIALRIIFDLHKNYRPLLADKVQPFLDLVRTLYASVPNTVQRIFGDAYLGSKVDSSVSPTSTSTTTSPTPTPKPLTESSTSTSSSSTKTNDNNEKELTPSVSSFKVLTECPLIVMLLFQLYPRYIQANIHVLIPLMMSTLKLQFVKPPTVPHLHKKFCELAASQVKSLSFLTYLLRGFDGVMRPYEKTISDCVVNLLKSCPSESLNTRKELLVATRHILATDFRKGFFAQIDTLLKTSVLIGEGRSSYDTLRPLAYVVVGVFFF
jgi:transformation/transcription domain-associated protein